MALDQSALLDLLGPMPKRPRLSAPGTAVDLLDLLVTGTEPRRLEVFDRASGIVLSLEPVPEEIRRPNGHGPYVRVG